MGRLAERTTETQRPEVKISVTPRLRGEELGLFNDRCRGWLRTWVDLTKISDRVAQGFAGAIHDPTDLFEFFVHKFNCFLCLFRVCHLALVVEPRMRIDRA